MMYISENYSHNITLDDMAAYLRISPHLSILSEPGVQKKHREKLYGCTCRKED